MSAAVCSICEDSSCGLATCIPCGHVFGKKCISQWMRTSYNNGCPTCRERIQKVQRIFLDNDSIGYQDYKENTPKTDRGKIVQLKEKTAQAKIWWNRRNSGVQIFIIFLLVLGLSVVVHDANNERGVIQVFARPFLYVGRFFLYIGRCLLNVLFVICYFVPYLVSTVFVILKYLFSILFFLLKSLGNAVVILLKYTVKML
ncbi:uncharacterized protein LOC121386854 isoform X1 [Gigantopelta aegis]|uniref:uncharacterized protein LOC121386854 isoform X1 n=1 Tax=Gigantopelta aegis TaxID=1735272 RepID=UPI001B88A19F|nr:uncharacterized protein LOC121386854 isoform X1 [Gigantopelta aegis]XP_041373809.1 uncharacterized protein LOC121386854 isoform X1 [Gigantopelta aegis]